MPNPTKPDTLMLTPQQVEDLETEFRRQFVMSHPGLMLNLSMLCQTLRAAWAENHELRSLVGIQERESDSDMEIVGKLLARLAQVEGERASWRRVAEKLEQEKVDFRVRASAATESAQLIEQLDRGLPDKGDE